MSDSTNDPHVSPEPLSWERVWNDELDQVAKRRRLAERRELEKRGEKYGRPAQSGENGADCRGSSHDHPGKSLDEVTKRALSLNLVGLAFSGGGIRSATFNLGILQGLAEQKLLKHVDYLSTVSGGGYIGAWFGALIRRQGGDNSGFVRTEELLHPIRRMQPSGVESHSESATAEAQREPEPIAHLRAYSNFLAPRIGLFSQDSLSLISAYVRNLVASLLVLLPALIGVIAVVRLGHSAFVIDATRAIRCSEEIAATVTVLSMVAALVLMGIAIGRIRDIRRHQQKEQVPAAHRVHLSPGIYTVIVLLLLLSAASAVWLLSLNSTPGQQRLLDLSSIRRQPLLTTVFFAGLIGVCYVLQELWQGMTKFRFTTLFARATGGAAGGLLIWLAVKRPFSVGKEIDQSLNFVIVIPLILFTWIIGSKIALALAARDIDEDEREWWGRLAATLARAALVWLVATAIIIFSPAVVEHCGYLLRGTVTIGWIGTTIGGLIVGRSQAAGSSGPLRRLFLSAVPYVFLVGLLCGLALAVSNGIDEPASEGALSRCCTLLERFEHYEERLRRSHPWDLTALLVVCVVVGGYASYRIDVNSTSLNSMYANRLARCYLGATRAKEIGSELFGKPVSLDRPRRQPHPWTDFDALDDLELSELRVTDDDSRPRFDGPFHLFNTAINLSGAKSLAQQDRKANSFTLTPLACGNPRLGFRPTADGDKGRQKGFAGNLTVGRAVAISGAAANSNMGERTSPALAALMTLFNVRLGWWVGNPRDSRRWNMAGPKWALGSLLVEMMSGTDSEHGFVNLSDGGHFENMGVYELVRRRCRYIIAVDCGADPGHEFEDLSNLVRKCRIDLGIEIQINSDSVRRDPKTGRARWHCAIGAIRYDYLDANAPLGTLVYIKPVMTGDEPPDLVNYAGKHSDFPQQTTADQFFDESQFESYRELGHHTAWAVFTEAARWSRGSNGQSPSAG
jgi:hypothetical protein